MVENQIQHTVQPSMLIIIGQHQRRTLGILAFRHCDQNFVRHSGLSAFWPVPHAILRYLTLLTLADTLDLYSVRPLTILHTRRSYQKPTLSVGQYIQHRLWISHLIAHFPVTFVLALVFGSCFFVSVDQLIVCYICWHNPTLAPPGHCSTKYHSYLSFFPLKDLAPFSLYKPHKETIFTLQNIAYLRCLLYRLLTPHRRSFSVSLYSDAFRQLQSLAIYTIQEQPPGAKVGQYIQRLLQLNIQPLTIPIPYHT